MNKYDTLILTIIVVVLFGSLAGVILLAADSLEIIERIKEIVINQGNYR